MGIAIEHKKYFSTSKICPKYITTPSQFLTFMRHITVRSTIRPSTIHPRPSIAQSAGCRIAAPQVRYASSGVTTHGYGPGKKEHAVNKEGLDIQSDAAKQARS